MYALLQDSNMYFRISKDMLREVIKTHLPLLIPAHVSRGQNMKMKGLCKLSKKAMNCFLAVADILNCESINGYLES